MSLLQAKEDTMMKTRAVRTTRVTLAAAAATLGVMASAASAQAKPVLSLSLPAQADAGVPTAFSWSAQHAVKGGRVVVQRQVGTAHVWRTAAKLTGGSGSGQLPALSLGDYRIRIANIKGGRVKSQQAHLLRVFGTVPFTALFKNGTSGPAGVSQGTYTTPTRTFDYFLEADIGGGDQDELAFTVQHNRCR